MQNFMKTLTFLTPVAMGAGLVLLFWSGCTPSNKSATTRNTPTPDRTGVTVPAVPPAKTVKATPVASGSASVQASDTWAAIKDLPFAQRAEFAAGAASLENELAGQISEMNAKRAAMTASTTDWDFAMKELNDSQAYLKSMVEEAGRATPETWDQEKDKVGAAWLRAQTACDRVRTSTTS